jgi:hypothetical protein
VQIDGILDGNDNRLAEWRLWHVHFIAISAAWPAFCWAKVLARFRCQK